MEISVRPYTPADFLMVSRWWFEWEEISLEPHHLPNDGFIVSVWKGKDLIPAAAAFLFIPANSKVCQIGYPVSSPSENLSPRERHAALKTAIDQCLQAAIKIGAKEVIALSDKSGISGVYEKLKFRKIRAHTFLAYGNGDP